MVLSIPSMCKMDRDKVSLLSKAMERYKEILPRLSMDNSTTAV